MPTDPSAKPEDASGLSQLTVAQLKALCKERKIAGYSKLGKQALVQKLVESGYFPNGAAAPVKPGVPLRALAVAASVGPPSSGPPPTDAPPPASSEVLDSSRSKSAVQPAATNAKTTAPKTKSKPRQKTAPAKSTPVASERLETTVPSQSAEGSVSGGVPCALRSSVGNPPVLANVDIEVPVLHDNPSVAPSPRAQALSLSSLPAASGSISSRSSTPAPKPHRKQTKGKKRTQPDKEAMPPPPPKKARIHPSIPASRGSQTLALPRTAVPSRRSSKGEDVSTPIQAVTEAITVSGATKATPISTAPAQRFKPLVIGAAKVVSSSALPAPPSALLSVRTASVHRKDAHPPLQYLEFPAPVAELPTLRAITLPPPLAQRKRVSRWAVILSGLSDKERAVCVLVSRTFRYAVYLSASSILGREYGGRRLRDDVLRSYSQAMINMWPYLRVREAEVVARQRIYKASFLPQLLQRFNLRDPISKPLWASPDNPKQLAVAVRFALTRAWFELSVGISSGAKDDPTSWLRGVIVGVHEVVEGEIWAVTLEYPQECKRETLYALEATCEVVGRPLASASDGPGAASLPMRADWSAYIARRNAFSPSVESLLSHLKWSCHEEFDRGISRLWLKRVAGEGEIGVAKRTVAERYVLACVVGNSISGAWLSTSEMAQDFAGLPSRGAAPAMPKTKDPAVNLYLPEHHHVESVHFTSAGGVHLHPALATVQTPHREYYILRDNGMQVGCEEDGVAAVWQEVLSCNHRGMPA